jgi:hypothetical protein
MYPAPPTTIILDMMFSIFIRVHQNFTPRNSIPNALVEVIYKQTSDVHANSIP